VMREVVMQNSRASHTLARARAASTWLSVSLEGFGRRTLAPAEGLLTIGDAASFIDPFTGSGMLMALESGQVAAAVVARHLSAKLLGAHSFGALARDYRAEYSRTFHSRLRVSGVLRRAAFVTGLAEAAVITCGVSSRVRHKLALATRRAPDNGLSAPTRS
jgi:flavin-dependent dehydrogenase